MEIDLNKHIGKKIKDRRQRFGMTLETLSQKLGVSIHQVTKYESGLNRVPVEALYKLTIIFEVPFNFFFEGFDYDPEQALQLTIPESISLANKCPMNILLIEDDAGDEFIIRKFIEELQCSVNIYSVHDGQSALDILRNNRSNTLFTRPDIVILDLSIPKRDGNTVLQEIKRHPEIKDIPVIIVTNSFRKEEMMNVYKKYASGYICKSGDLDVFRKQIHTLIQYWSFTVVLPRMN
ncbi:MAG: response regulator [Lutibacter sp.]